MSKQLSCHYDRVIKKNSRDNNVHMSHNNDKNRSKSGNRNRLSSQKCEWCQSKRHKLENCPYVKTKDRSMYKFNYCDGAWNYEDRCFKKKKDEEKRKEYQKYAVMIQEQMSL